MTDPDVTHAAHFFDSLRDRLSVLRKTREELRREQEDLISLPRAHAEIMEDIDQALAAAAQDLDAKAARIIRHLTDTRPWRTVELTGAIAGMLGKKVSAGGFTHFLADPSALVVLLAHQLRERLAAQLEKSEPGIPADERAERLEAVRNGLADIEAKMRDTIGLAKRAGLDISRRRAA